jgi:hypothetical protein
VLVTNVMHLWCGIHPLFHPVLTLLHNAKAWLGCKEGMFRATSTCTASQTFYRRQLENALPLQQLADNCSVKQTQLENASCSLTEAAAPQQAAEVRTIVMA